MEEVYVGIDVSKQWLDVGRWPQPQALRVSNDGAGVAELVARVTEWNPRAVVLEATGGLELLAAVELHSAGFKVAVVNPRRSREFARSQGIGGKTDRLDARMLAEFAQSKDSQGRLLAMRLAEQEELELKALVLRRRQLIGMLVAETNRRERAPKVVRKSIVQAIKGLKRAVAEVEQQLKQLLARAPRPTPRPRCSKQSLELVLS